jgi:eukaryotic-like serine/threonine-protein kinase
LNPDGALSDFRSAERLNPQSMPALQNQVFVLLEKLNRPDEALAVLDRGLAVQPDFAPSLVTRAQIYARRGKADLALRDVTRALEADGRPHILYQAAGVYALLAPIDRAHGRRAIGLLAAAFRTGYGMDDLRNDRDLDAIRDWPEFQTVVDAAKALSSVEGR